MIPRVCTPIIIGRSESSSESSSRAPAQRLDSGIRTTWFTMVCARMYLFLPYLEWRIPESQYKVRRGMVQTGHHRAEWGGLGRYEEVCDLYIPA